MPGGKPEPGGNPVANSSQDNNSALVMVLNHNRDQLQELTTALVRSGYQVREADSLAQSCRLLSQARPDVVVLNPLILCAGGVELELLESLQRDDDPIPVILLVDDLQSLLDARLLKMPFRDFVLRPHTPAECVHRVELAVLARRKIRALQHRARYLEGQVSVDFKTGLISELYFKRILALEFKRAQRHQNPVSLMLVDVDDFKGVNDQTEYAFGDEVLRRVGEALKGNVRETDFAARCGGDEFCVLLPHTSAAEAVPTALRIRQRVAAMQVRSGNYSRQVTVSIGIDSFDGRSTKTVDGLRRNANKALQEAKRRGKNQVWLWSGAERPDAGGPDSGTDEGSPSPKPAAGPAAPGEAAAGGDPSPS